MTYITTKSQNQPLNRKNASGVLSHCLLEFQDLSWTRNRCHSRRTLFECACPVKVHNRCCEFPVPVNRGTDHSARDPKQLITPRDHVGGFHVSSEKQNIYPRFRYNHWNLPTLKLLSWEHHNLKKRLLHVWRSHIVCALSFFWFNWWKKTVSIYSIFHSYQ